ncbi:MAG: methyltransferase [Caulobacter sp.]|nr:methyltransferase [Caulobacter sp.]
MGNDGRLRPGALINRWLGGSGFQLVRSEALARLTDAAGRQDALAARVAALEARSDPTALEDLIRYAMKAHWRLVDQIEAAAGDEDPGPCALCGHIGPAKTFERLESRCQFLGGRLVRWRCPACEVIFGPRKMLDLDDEMVALEYRNLYRVYAEADSTEQIVRTFHLLDPRRDGVYLDFGCGGGWSDAIDQLRRDGWRVDGFEPSARNASPHVAARWDEIEARRYDGVFSHNVLEHLLDPIGTTARLAARLAPGGRLIHATPCFDYVYEYSHFHVFFFTGRSPEVLAARAGLKIVDWARDGLFQACVLEADPGAG